MLSWCTGAPRLNDLTPHIHKLECLCTLCKHTALCLNSLSWLRPSWATGSLIHWAKCACGAAQWVGFK